MGKPVYAGRHQAERSRRIARMHDGDPCCLCGKPMFRGQHRRNCPPDCKVVHLDLDHVPGTAAQYRGLAHERCNRADGGRRRHRAAQPSGTLRTSRTW